jgi:protoheme IX farnesyltransferase
MVGGGAGALNQLIERRYDAMMKRTEQRPLPAGRLLPVEALLFGCIIGATGVAELLFFVNPLSAFLAAGTLVSYLFLYTPLKRITPYATIVGALPGALPPLIGWAGARGAIDPGGLLLFGILFFWQIPHFLSLGWMYRRDYARAGYRLLAVVDSGGKRSGAQGLAHTVALVVVTVLPWWTGMFGPVYLAGALLAGGLFLAAGWKLYSSRSNTAARRVFAASLAYLPALMAFMVLDRLTG